MRSNSDFWLNLHSLANDLEREGKTNEERVASLLELLHYVSPATRAVYQENALMVLNALRALSEKFGEPGEGGASTETA
jgi:hypothetical protein